MGLFWDYPQTLEWKKKNLLNLKKGKRGWNQDNSSLKDTNLPGMKRVGSILFLYFLYLVFKTIEEYKFLELHKKIVEKFMLEYFFLNKIEAKFFENSKNTKYIKFSKANCIFYINFKFIMHSAFKKSSSKKLKNFCSQTIWILWQNHGIWVNFHRPYS